MPYRKKVKDYEGAVAEAVGSDVARLVGLAHPAKDTPEIIITKDKSAVTVTLPMLQLEESLSDKLMSGMPMPRSPDFLKSLGKAIAVNWYLGQADLNITNVALHKGLCYAYDFDCCFQNVQSPTSFARNRSAEYDSVDLDTLTTDSDIIRAALKNLESSAATLGMADSLSYLFDPATLAIIESGFTEGIDQIAAIKDEDLVRVIDKHSKDADQDNTNEAYLGFFREKHEHIKAMRQLVFKEPDKCDYLYVDESNRVHLLLPLVGGESIGLDNTCKTTLELKKFFHGRPSAMDELIQYKNSLEKDIQAIGTETHLSRYAYRDLMRGKKQRLDQVKNYIHLMGVLMSSPEYRVEIDELRLRSIPKFPKALHQLLQSSQNAFAVRLAPDKPDPFTRFDDPTFSLKRNYASYARGYQRERITEGLGARLLAAFQPGDSTQKVTRDKKNAKEEVIGKILAKISPDCMNDPAQLETQLDELKIFIQEELKKIDPNLSISRTHDEQELILDYAANILGLDETATPKEWIEGILEATVDSSVWDSVSSSVFDELQAISTEDEADKMSIKIQFLLAEVNYYCRAKGLSTANFGMFFDEEPQASEFAQLVKEAFVKGEDVESIVYQYINKNHTALGMSSPLDPEQQKQISSQFTEHYTTIKDSPHFDEFFIVDPDAKGNVFSHQNRITCHFLDFFARHTTGKHSLGSLDGHAAALQQSALGRLPHKNERVTQEYNTLKEFRAKVIELLNKNDPEALVRYLSASSPSGTPNYSMLALETQNYIAYNRNWPAIKAELNMADYIPSAQKLEMQQLLDRSHLKHAHLAAIVWSKQSTKPLLEVELHKVANGLNNTVDIYEGRRDKGVTAFIKGAKHEVREQQCADIRRVADNINQLLKTQPLAEYAVLAQLLHSIDVLNRIDDAISSESNWFKSDLQREIQVFRSQLIEMCQLHRYEFNSADVRRVLEVGLQEQLGQIKDPAVKTLAKSLPAHCHTDEAIAFFNRLTLTEMTQLTSYLSIEYLELNSFTDKETLFTRAIPQLFAAVNGQVLAQLDINDADFLQQLEQLADRIPPEYFTQGNIESWAQNASTFNEASLPDLLARAAKAGHVETVESRSLREFYKYRDSMMQKRPSEPLDDSTNSTGMRI